MKKQYLLLLLFFMQTILFAQQITVRGIVLDDQKKPLPFANVYVDAKHGTVTNIDGEFSLNLKHKVDKIYVSYIGFIRQEITDFSKKYQTIILKPNANSINEVVLVAKENPALKYIRGAIANKLENDIKALDYYKYDSYQKLVVTANPDSIKSTIDTLYITKEGKRTMVLDSSNYQIKKDLDRSHFYMTEKASEVKYKRHVGRKETVLASRMAGFKQPIYEVFAVNFQSFSFYEDTYTILGNSYVNPITKKGLKTYNYKILDTLVNNKDSIFLIHFKQKTIIKGKGIEGLLYIEGKSFALTKALAEYKGGINIAAKQKFKYYKKQDIWFPVVTELLLKKGADDMLTSISLFPNGSTTMSTEKKNNAQKTDTLRAKHDANTKANERQIYMLIKTDNFNIKLNEALKIKNISNAIEFDDNAANRSQEFWNKYRTDSISTRGLETYVVMDSLVQKEGIENKINLGRKVLKGYFPTKYFDLNLNQLMNYNQYEGFRLGIGGKTNENVSRKFEVDAYAAYGFKNKKINYHGGVATRLNKKTNTWLGIGYTDDIHAISKTTFITDGQQLFINDLSLLNNQFFYKNKAISAYLKHDLRSNVMTRLQVDYARIENTIPYAYNSATTNVNGEYNLALAKFGVQWNPFSTYMNTPNGKITLKNKYPQVSFQATKSFGNSDFDFSKYEIKVKERLKTGLGTTAITFMMGISTGEVPITHLFGGKGNVGVGKQFPNSFNIAGLTKFETMEKAQYFADQYSFFQIRHSLKRIKITKKIKPEFSFLYRFVLGDIKDLSNHTSSLTMRSISDGYSEAGLEINKLLFGMGIGLYQRTGASRTTVSKENFALKLTYRLSF
jgi:hypothetical protein